MLEIFPTEVTLWCNKEVLFQRAPASSLIDPFESDGSVLLSRLVY